jgi:hypothetical protein
MPDSVCVRRYLKGFFFYGKAKGNFEKQAVRTDYP